MKNTMNRTDNKAVAAVRVLLCLAAIALIIVSMVTDKTTPYLAMGLSLTAVANMMGCVGRRSCKKEGND